MLAKITTATKCLIGAPETNKIPPKIIKTNNAVPKSLSNIISASITTKPGKIKLIGFLPATKSIRRNWNAHQSIKPNLANSDGCSVKPAISIQFLFPLIFFPRDGTKGSSNINIESVKLTLANLGHISPLTLYTQYEAAAPRIKKKNCLINIE